jgi:hypothetical protein
MSEIGDQAVLQGRVQPIVEAAGLDPGDFQAGAYAEPLNSDGWLKPLPAVLVGTYRGHMTAIRAWPVIAEPDSGRVTRWDAIALISAHPGLALNELSARERERLRAEALTPSGLEAPVGQERVVSQPAPHATEVPYAPPLPARETTGVAEDDPRDVQLEPAGCGGPNCVTFVGPSGRQEAHDANTCPQSAEADRG